MFEEGLKRWAEETGRRFAVSGLEVLSEVRERLGALREGGQIEPGFFFENLNGFRYLDDLGVEDPEAVLMVSVPAPAHVVAIDLGSGPVDGIFPPTYVRYRALFEDILKELRKALGSGAAIGTLKAPLKSISVRMGLTKYGRNNVTYVPGFGSYHQLCGYVVGGEAGKRLRKAFGRPAPEPFETSLDLCGTCRACLKACPTGAIRKDRFLISAEKCYTLYSERGGTLPDGLPTAASACFVGCLACQEACPENRGKLKHERMDVAFTKAETDVLLELGRREAAGEGSVSAGEGHGACGPAPAGIPLGLWAGIVSKFERLDVSESIGSMGRNLEMCRRTLGAPDARPS